MPFRDLRRIIAEPQTNPLKLLAPIALVTLCFCAICAYVLLEARRTAWERAGDAAASLTKAIESDLVRNIDTLDLSLQAVIDNLKHPEVGQISPQLRQLVLFDRSATARHLGAILVTDDNGILRYDSRNVDPKPIDLTGRDYFRVHGSGESPGLYIGRPERSRQTGQPFVGISRRLTNADGSFGGVVVGSLRLSYFKQMFEGLKLDPRSNITLVHTDGTVLMRWPYEEGYVGLNIRHAEVFKHMATSSTGRFETNSVTDGVRRLVVYRQAADLPIVIGIGQSTDDVYGQWRSTAWIIGLLIGVLCALSATLAWVLQREFARHNATRRKLATLAITDGLTGLANRWQFDQAMQREWRLATDNRTALALLMIDTDLFKSYNDTHGHQAGDHLLRVIATAILDCIQPAIDLGTRYGGDEFAVLLPGGSLPRAEETAVRIRARLAELCVQHDIGPDAHVSIGVASIEPDISMPHSALLTAADKALYRAKSSGGDRVAAAEATSASPQSSQRRAA